MCNFKKLFFTIFICIFFLCAEKANAGTASNVVDKSIKYTANATYYVTKYTLKAGWFIIKKTSKGVKAISISIFNGTKDAFGSTPKTIQKPIPKPDIKKSDSIYILPPAPKIN